MAKNKDYDNRNMKKKKGRKNKPTIRTNVGYSGIVKINETTDENYEDE